ncbi:MAG: hypothetical protein A3F70_02100 [Acidobacteria bacterium RIFCSPLOWO2_12_FULL_67_14]|nr:MAG: hypothetical protein A3F70_02100 [Acidobacteria bacterium RIFCSPLOWO2_12_FULL_67_14]
MTMHIRRWLALFVFCAAAWPLAVYGQGVTTGSITGVVSDPNQQPPVAGATVIAIHEPSGTSYEAVTRADGRFSIPGMRVADRTASRSHSEGAAAPPFSRRRRPM